MAEATISITERGRSTTWKDEVSAIPQYTLGKILLIWAAAAIPMGVLQAHFDLGCRLRGGGMGKVRKVVAGSASLQIDHPGPHMLRHAG